jgi:Mg/Co/Ni transporter MgtE
MEDFQRDYAKKYFPRLTPEEQSKALEHLSPERLQAVLQSLPPEERRRACPRNKSGSTSNG